MEAAFVPDKKGRNLRDGEREQLILKDLGNSLILSIVQLLMFVLPLSLSLIHSLFLFHSGWIRLQKSSLALLSMARGRPMNWAVLECATTEPLVLLLPAPTPIQTVALIGERNSGTTWMLKELRRCYQQKFTVLNHLTRHRHYVLSIR